MNGAWPAYRENISQPWFTWAIVMGIGFVVSFNMIAITVQKSGLAVASVASKLSLIIPFVAAIFLYGESITVFQVAGIIVAAIGVILTLYPHPTDPQKEGEKESSSQVLLPVFVFLITGLLDSLVKYVEKTFLDGNNNNEYLVTAFSAAFAGGLLFFIYQLMIGSAHIQMKAVLAGLLIGVPNYFSIWCLMKVLKMFPGESAIFLPVNNMGIVLGSALVAAVVFKEHLRKINWAGIIFSIIAICLIAFG